MSSINHVSENDPKPATATMGDHVARQLEELKKLQEKPGTEAQKKGGGHSAAPTKKGGLMAILPGAKRLLEADAAGAAQKRVEEIAERSGGFLSIIAAIPGEIVRLSRDLELRYKALDDRLALRTSYDERQRLFAERKKLDAEFDVYFTASYPNTFTEDEKETAQKYAKVAFGMCQAMSCHPEMMDLRKVADKLKEIGVLVQTTKETFYVWIGKEKYSLAEGVRSVEQAVLQSVTEENLPEFRGFPGIIRKLQELSGPAKVNNDAHIATLQENLKRGVTEGATVEDLISLEKGREVMVVVTDPGEVTEEGKTFFGGQIRVFRSSEGIVFPQAVMGGNHNIVERLMAAGVSIPVALLSVEKLDRATLVLLDGNDRLLHRILRRSVKEEQRKLAKRRAGETKLAVDVKSAEEIAQTLSGNENVPVISLADFYAGKAGITIVSYRGAWRNKEKGSDGKTFEKPYFNPCFVVERKFDGGQTVVGARFANEPGTALCKVGGFDIGVFFPEKHENHPNEPFSGVWAPLRFILQVNGKPYQQEKQDEKPVIPVNEPKKQPKVGKKVAAAE